MTIDWSRTRVRLVPRQLGRVRCESGWSLEKRGATAVPDFDLWFVWAGRGEMQSDAGNFHLRPGVCVWMRPDGWYLAQQDAGDRLGVTFIHFDLIDRRGKVRPWTDPTPPVYHDVSDVNFVDAVMRRVVELMRASDQATAEALMSGLLMDLDAASQRDESTLTGGTQLHHHRTMMALASRICERPNETPPVAELAGEAGYSADHFTRVFKSVTGRTPQDFVVQARLNRACQLLTESTLSIGQIAAALGYDDIYFFSKQFRRKMNCTPSDYRQRRVFTAEAQRSQRNQCQEGG